MVRNMGDTYAAITEQDSGWWIGWVEEVPAVDCQERSREELIGSRGVALREALEFNREEARKAAAPDYTEHPLIV